MILTPDPVRMKDYRFPRSIVGYAVWAYHRFALSLRDVEDLLAERGIIVSHETIPVWCKRFGPQISAQISRTRPHVTDKSHLDEVVIRIRGRKHWFWRAIDSNGDTLEILVKSRRNGKAGSVLCVN